MGDSAIEVDEVQVEIECPSCGLSASPSPEELPTDAARDALTSCPVCEEKFHPDEIQQHVNSCLDIQQEAVPCPVCSKPFRSAEAVDMHISCEHEPVIFECPICFENKGKRALPVCCKQELCQGCASQQLRTCPFCRAAVFKWVPSAPEEEPPEEGCGCFAILLRLCGLGALLRRWRGKR